MSKKVKWKEIEAEADGYKAGFVSLYQKYEGMPTDKVVRGKVVMVTERSFADHFGIDPETFRRWVKVATDAAYSTPEAKAARTAASHASVVKNMARTSARDLASSILKAGPAAADQVYHELRQQRAGVDTTPANRKAAEAKTNEVGAAMIKAAVHNVKCITIAPAIDEMNEDVEEAISTGTVSVEVLEAIEQAAKRLLNTVVAGKVFVS